MNRRELPINRFNAEILIPELRAAGKTVTVSVYPEQTHCFCIQSGLPRPNGLLGPASWPSAALAAFRDIDAFCRRYLRTQPKQIEEKLVTLELVRS